MYAMLVLFVQNIFMTRGMKSYLYLYGLFFHLFSTKNVFLAIFSRVIADAF